MCCQLLCFFCSRPDIDDLWPPVSVSSNKNTQVFFYKGDFTYLNDLRCHGMNSGNWTSDPLKRPLPTALNSDYQFIKITPERMIKCSEIGCSSFSVPPIISNTSWTCHHCFSWPVHTYLHSEHAWWAMWGLHNFARLLLRGPSINKLLSFFRVDLPAPPKYQLWLWQKYPVHSLSMMSV